MTQPGDPTPAAARELGDRIAALEEKVGTLESNQSSPRLPYASVDAGYIQAKDALGQVKAKWGMQHDGTFGMIYLNGTPPPAPSTPELVAHELAVTVYWDGTFAGGVEKPKDFERVDIYVFQPLEDYVGDPLLFTPDGTNLFATLFNEGAVTIPADVDPTYVRMIAVSNANVASTPTGGATITPLPASKIAAGAIGTEALAAEIVLSTDFVAGDPNGDNLRFNAAGLTQTTNGVQSIALGPGAAAGNYLLIVDPATGQTLASINSEGALTCTDIAITGSSTLNGTSIEDLIESRSKGLIARGSFTSYSLGTTTTKKGVMTLGFTAEPEHAYEIKSSPILIRGDGSLPYNSIVCALGLRYTDNGTIPTTSSSLLFLDLGFNDTSHQINILYHNTTGVSKEIRMLMTMETFDSQAIDLEVTSSRPMQMWVTDESTQAPPSTGVVGQASPPRQYTKTYTATWSNDYDVNTLTSIEGSFGSVMVQGGPDAVTDYAALFGFDTSTITTDLTGATIQKCELYLTCSWAHLDSGCDAHIGTSTTSGTPPATYPTSGLTRDRVVTHFNQPQGRWVDVGTTIGNEFKAGTTKAFILDASADSFDLANYGQFYEQGSLFNPPRLRVTYTK